jgi:hypothetical protein
MHMHTNTDTLAHKETTRREGSSRHITGLTRIKKPSPFIKKKNHLARRQQQTHHSSSSLARSIVWTYLIAALRAAKKSEQSGFGTLYKCLNTVSTHLIALNKYVYDNMCVYMYKLCVYMYVCTYVCVCVCVCVYVCMCVCVLCVCVCM